MKILNKKSIIQKTIEVGGSTFLSRILGLFREVILARFLPLGIISDAFFSAYKLPNMLRKVFAEGALSAAFIPVIVGIEKNETRHDSNSLMSLSFIIFEGFLALFCFLIYLKADFIISLTTPGFSKEQVALTVPLLKILIFLILFLSSSSLLAGALQSVHHFFIPAISPVLLNLIFIGASLIGIWYNLSVEFLCYAILFAGFCQFLLHLFMYFKLNFSFDSIDSNAWKNFKQLFKKFLPILFSMSLMEIILFLDESLASYLPAGSISLIYYANRFMGIPLGVFATAFSTILFPHFSRISAYAPKRLSFYLYESTKLIFWITIPVTILMIFFSKQIFVTLFLSSKFPMTKVVEASYILSAFLIGLFFFSINKILTNIYYSLHDTFIPTTISVIAMAINLLLNFILMRWFKATGLAIAMSLSLGLLQSALLLLFLFKQYNFTIYPKHLFKFLLRYIIQLIFGLIFFFVAYYLMVKLILYLPTGISNFLLNKIGFWLWTSPLSLLFFLMLYKSKKQFGIKLYFLD